MLNEEISDKTVNLAISTTKLTGRAIARGLSQYLQYRKQKKMARAVNPAEDRKHGRQTVRELISQNQGVSSLPVGETGIRDFERIAKRYGVDFAVVRDRTEEPPKYIVFFKARDADAISQVLSEYTARQMERQSRNRPSIRKALAKFKELVANMPRRERETRREQSR